MATMTGSFTGDNSNTGIYIEYTYTQNVSDNTSTITAKLYINKKTQYGRTYKSNTPVTLKIDGATIVSKNVNVDLRPLSVGGKIELASGSKTITHTDTGERRVLIEGTADVSGTTLGVGTVKSNINLATIPREVKVTVDKLYPLFGDTIRIYHNGDSSLKFNVGYDFLGDYKDIAIKTTASYTDWKIPEELMNKIPSSISATMTIQLNTISSSNVYIGSSFLNISVTVPDTVKPSIADITLSEANPDKPSGLNGFYQHVSALEAVIKGKGIYGSTIDSYRLMVDGYNLYSETSTITTDTITSSGNISVTATVTDSRGRVGEFTKTVMINAYALPNITNFTYERMEIVDSKEKPSNMGNIGYVSFNTTFDSKATNKKTILKYKTESGSSWTTVTSGLNESRLQISSSLSISDAYIISLEAKDDIGSITKEIKMTNIYPLISMNPTGKGIAFGAEAYRDGIIDNNLNIYMGKNNFLNKSFTWTPTYPEAAIGKGCVIRGSVMPGHSALTSHKVNRGYWLQCSNNDDLAFSYIPDSYIRTNTDSVTTSYQFPMTPEGTYTVLGVKGSKLNKSYISIDTPYNDTSQGLNFHGGYDKDVYMFAGSGGFAITTGTSDYNLHFGLGGSTSAFSIKPDTISFGNKPVRLTNGQILFVDILKHANSNGWKGSWGVGVDCHFLPIRTGRGCGTANYRWDTCYLTKNPNVSSDRNLKEDIEYITRDINTEAQTTPTMRASSLTDTESKEKNITFKDMHEFISNNLQLTTYKFKTYDPETLAMTEEEYKEYVDNNTTQIGFIAQDIAEDKVGKYIVTKSTDGIYGYETGNFTSVIAGALKEEIKEREELEGQIKIIKENYEEALNLLLEKINTLEKTMEDRI